MNLILVQCLSCVCKVLKTCKDISETDDLNFKIPNKTN